MNFIKNNKSTLLLIFLMLAGALVGFFVKGVTVVLEPIATTYINLMFMIIVPLILVTIITAIGRLSDLKKIGKMFVTMLVMFFITELVASLFTLGVVTIFNPASGVSMVMNETAEIAQTADGGSGNFLSMLTVDDFIKIFSKDSLVVLVIVAVAIGVAIVSNREKTRTLFAFFEQLETVIMKLIQYILKLAPIGMFAFFAVLGEMYGGGLLGLARPAIIYTLGCLFYFIFFHSLYAYISGGRDAVKQLWRVSLIPTLHALGTCSSASTMPLILDACNEAGIPQEVSSTCVPLGTTFQKDGQVIGEIVQIAFICGILGMNFWDPIIMIKAVFVTILVSSVSAAIPTLGYSTEGLMIVSVMGFPPAALGILIAIGTIVDAPPTAVNAMGKVPLSMLVSRVIFGKSWNKKKAAA